MNPLLIKLLQGYIEFRKLTGQEEQRIAYPAKDLCAELGWIRVTSPRVTGLARQCNSLGIDFEHCKAGNFFKFTLSNLRLVVNYNELAKGNKT